MRTHILLSFQNVIYSYTFFYTNTLKGTVSIKAPRKRKKKKICTETADLATTMFDLTKE